MRSVFLLVNVMAQDFSRFRLFLCASTLALTLGACASTVDQTAAFKDLQTTVGARVDQDLAWRRDAASNAEVAAKVDALVAQELSLDAAVKIALLNNRGLQARYAEIGIANSDLVAAGLLSNPVLEFMIQSTSNPSDGNIIEFGIAQSVMGLFMLPARKKVAQAAFAQTQNEVASAVVETVNHVREAYVTALGARNALSVVKEVALAAETSRELAQRFHKAGNISDLQMAEEDAMAEDTAAMVDEAELEAIETLESLAAALNVNSEALKLPAQLPALPASDPAFENAETWALENRLDVLAKRKAVEFGFANLKLNTDWRLWKEFELSVAAEREPDGQWKVGPGFEIALPIFDQGGPEVARAAAEVLKAENELAELEAHVRADVRKALARVATTRKIVERYRSTILPLKQDIVRLKEERYNFMLIGVFDVLVAKRDETSAYLSYVNIVRDYWLARANLANAIGGAPVETSVAAEGATP